MTEETKGTVINSDKGPSLEELRQEVIKERKRLQKEDIVKVNQTEVMNIFNELLEWWYQSEEHIIENLGNHSDFIESDMNELRGNKADYIKRFKKALGVE